jgi:hypothetical protein
MRPVAGWRTPLPRLFGQEACDCFSDCGAFTIREPTNPSHYSVWLDCRKLRGSHYRSARKARGFKITDRYIARSRRLSGAGDHCDPKVTFTMQAPA